VFLLQKLVIINEKSYKAFFSGLEAIPRSHRKPALTWDGNGDSIQALGGC